MQTLKLGFIGVGNMAGAILGALLDRALLPPQNILLFDSEPKRLEPFLKRGATAAASNRELTENALLVILAVKPQVMGSVLAEIAPVSSGKNFITIAAGLPTTFYKQRLDPKANVLRVMPNAPLMVQCGATVLAQSEGVSEDLLHTARAIFESAGDVVVLKEELLNEITSLTGSSPAYFYRMAEAMVQTAVDLGVPRDIALPMVARTMQGSALMMLKSDLSPSSLIEAVCSPGGTTLAAMASFDESDFDDAVRQAMLACTRRGYELGAQVV